MFPAVCKCPIRAMEETWALSTRHQDFFSPRMQNPVRPPIQTAAVARFRFIPTQCARWAPAIGGVCRRSFIWLRAWRKVVGMKGQGFIRRFGYALNGVVAAFRRERSMRTHGLAVIGVVIFLALTGAAALWWAQARGGIPADHHLPAGTRHREISCGSARSGSVPNRSAESA